jgi:hypothetical protein
MGEAFTGSVRFKYPVCPVSSNNPLRYLPACQGTAGLRLKADIAGYHAKARKQTSILVSKSGITHRTSSTSIHSAVVWHPFASISPGRWYPLVIFR